MTPALHQRLVSELRLALLADCGCEDTLRELKGDARATGLTGAEIDTALRGSSFEARTTAALRYACALKATDRSVIVSAREQLHAAGFSDVAISEITKAVQAILAD